MKVTIFGASGLLGKALLQQWKGDEITGLTSSDADIRDQHAVRDALKKTNPDWIVLSAAYTDVDGCENNPALAFSVNRDGAVNVGKAAQEVGAKLLFLSTDYVFDGLRTSPYEVDDPRNPQSVYGRSKAEAETQLLNVLPDCCIVRTSWLYGVGGRCFPDTILKLAPSRPTLDVVNDQRGSPTYVVDLARAIMLLCRANASGIVHATNTGNCTWFEFAAKILNFSHSSTEVRPVSSQQFPRPAPRPAYSVLAPDSLLRFGIKLPAWEAALQRYLSELKG